MSTLVFRAGQPVGVAAATNSPSAREVLMSSLPIDPRQVHLDRLDVTKSACAMSLLLCPAR